MRADRLLSLLMLLQSRGRLTATRLAEELEVSVRTIYRDIDALGSAGVPVTCERGPGGGCALLDSYRSNLTGLTTAEVRALFMLSIPASLSQLGVGKQLKAALLKLSASLPPERRRDPVWVRQRIHLDWSGKPTDVQHTTCLQTLQNALWQDRKLVLGYRLEARNYARDFERVVAPLGLVARAGVWYLVGAAGGHRQVYRASSILRAEVLEIPFNRPADFDLASFWTDWWERHADNRPTYQATVLISQELARQLPWWLGDAAQGAPPEVAPSDADGRLRLKLCFPSLETARTRLMGCGGAVEVLAPEALRLSVQDHAERILERYRS